MTVKELYEMCLERGFEDYQLMVVLYLDRHYIEDPVNNWDAPREDVVLLISDRIL